MVEEEEEGNGVLMLGCGSGPGESDTPGVLKPINWNQRNRRTLSCATHTVQYICTHAQRLATNVNNVRGNVKFFLQHALSCHICKTVCIGETFLQ